MRIYLLIVLLSLAGCAVSDPSKGDDSNQNNPPNNVNNVNNGNNGNNANNDVDMGVDGTPLRVVTFNTLRFFDTVCDSGQCESSDFEDVKSQGEFEFRAQQIADALIDIDADVVMLQEIETQACLDELERALGDSAYPISIMGETGGAATLDVALLARGELIQTTDHGDTVLTRPDGGTTTFAREFLEVEFERDGHRYIAFSAHFKAKRNDDPSRRFAEAEGARLIVGAAVSQNPDAVVVMGGDLNDTPDSAPLRELVSDGSLDLLTDVPGFYTFTFLDEDVALDHLLVGANEEAVLVPGSVMAVRGGLGGLAGSDHAAAVADLIVVE